MRQIGIIAAAGLYALKNNIARLKEDHEKARSFAHRLSEIPGIEVDLESVETNIVMFTVSARKIDRFLEECKMNGVLLGTGKVGVIRAVMHMDVSPGQVSEAAGIITKLLDQILDVYKKNAVYYKYNYTNREKCNHQFL